ncbi:MAG: hypothetical protein AB7S26_18730 [Sandaracinaceae bacterium]
MRTDAHISICKTDVRGGQLTRHAARRIDGGRAYGVSTGLGLPRTWSMSTEVVLDAFERGFADSKERDPGKRLQDAVGRARDALADACDGLVERLVPDATLVALSFDAGQLHVMSVGPGRVYLQRDGRPKRLTARDDERGGLLRVRPSICATPVEPGDLVLAGSITAFSMSAIAKAVSVLNEDPRTAPSILGGLLTEPAQKAGVGAAAVVLRVA